MEPVKKEKTGAEKRRFPRLEVAATVNYSILESPASEEITVTKNISAGGICLIMYEMVKVNSILSLKINFTDDGEIIEAKGKVVWVSEFAVYSENQKRYDVGVEFMELSKKRQEMLSKHVFRLLK